MSDCNKEYAEALFALAAEQENEAAYLAALEQVCDVIREHPAYGELLACPSLPSKEKDLLLEQAFGQLLPPQVLAFLQLLCAKGHSRLLEECVKDYRQLYEDAIARATAYVTSAVALTDKQQESLRQRLEQTSGRTVRLSCTVDKTLLGGIRVELDGKVLDGSLKHRLYDMKEVMEQ